MKQQEVEKLIFDIKLVLYNGKLTLAENKLYEIRELISEYEKQFITPDGTNGKNVQPSEFSIL